MQLGSGYRHWWDTSQSPPIILCICTCAQIAIRSVLEFYGGRDSVAGNVGCFVDAIGEAVTFGVIPLAHWTSVEGWTSFEVFACKLGSLDLFGWDPVSDLASVFI